MVFITEMKSVYSAVRTGSLNEAVNFYVLEVFISHSLKLIKLIYNTPYLRI